MAAALDSPEVQAGLELVKLLEDGELTDQEKSVFYETAEKLIEAKKNQVA